jgi:hypothetical protein
MKRMFVVFAVLAIFFGFAVIAFAARGPDPFAGLKITPPDESVSPEVRALYGKCGKWGDRGGWDGIWASPSPRVISQRQPGHLAVLRLGEKSADLQFGYGSEKILTRADVVMENGKVYLRTEPAGSITATFYIEGSKMKGTLIDGKVTMEISLIPLE